MISRCFLLQWCNSFKVFLHRSTADEATFQFWWHPRLIWMKKNPSANYKKNCAKLAWPTEVRTPQHKKIHRHHTCLPPSHKEARTSCVASGQPHRFLIHLCFHPRFYFTQILSNSITKYLYFSIFSPCAAFTKAIMHHKRKGRRSYLTSRSFSRFSSGQWQELDMAYETSFPLWDLSPKKAFFTLP